ncbi:MAG: transcription elongation factor GreA [Patescibacteria group bacterium]|nr:transcription elongation factor GreA [Candidatus Saccharibacteria bacterium]MDQ5963704.1 transcription elongation factor GreA [Patescibacteria group bacterium]
MKKQFHLTKEGVRELEAEKEVLLAKRSETAEAIKVARELGDLSENAEYQSARAEQDKTDARLDEISYILANVSIIKGGSGTKVTLGSKVSLSGPKGKKLEVQVVGTMEANPAESKISDESPVGQALLGKVVGDEVEITTPVSKTTYKLVSIG